MPCFTNMRACRSMMSLDWLSRPTTLTPRERVCRFASGPVVARKRSIMSKASSPQYR